jgi:hypothetical protein
MSASPPEGGHSPDGDEPDERLAPPLRRDYRDLATGALAIGLGLFGAIHASTAYDLGTFRRMGPGMMPMLFGVLMVVLGVAVLVPGVFREYAAPKISLRAPLTITAGFALFAVSIERVGLVPATFLLTLVASQADRRLGIVGVLILAAALSTLAVVVFVLALGIPLEPFGPWLRWR